MGGGTVTIPLLVFFGGVEQRVAACANLFSFLPMSGFALHRHAKNKLLKTQGILWLILPALLLSIIGSFLMGKLSSAFLQKAFGVFLIILAVAGFLNRQKP